MKVKSKFQLLVILFPSFIFLAIVVFIEMLPAQSCIGHSLSSRGYGSKVKQFAELNAIRHWETEAKNIHAGLSGWHRAEAKSMSCRRVAGDKYYYCRAFAKPCRSTLANKDEVDVGKLKPKTAFSMFRNFN